jgi:hypothetical protein
VFMTGYGADNIDARFKEVPVLHKPIEQDTLRRVFTVNGRSGESSVPAAHVAGADHVAGGFVPKGADPLGEAPGNFTAQ